jgi:hypothetical protein
MSGARERLPDRRASGIFSFPAAGQRYLVSFSHFRGTTRLAEIFLDSGNPNSLLKTHASDSAVLVNLLLGYGVYLEIIRHSAAGPVRAALDLLAAEFDSGAP